MANIKMGYSLEHDKFKFVDTDILSDKFLRINQCGMYQASNSDFLVDRPKRRDYMLIYISVGTAEFWFNDEKIHAQKGDLLLLRPGIPLKYNFHTNSIHYYIHFSGTSAYTLLSECSLYYSGKYPVGKFQEFVTTVNTLCSTLLQRNIYTEYSANSSFILLLGQICAKITNIDTQSMSTREVLVPAIQAMMAEFHLNHPLSYYANLCSMSPSYFKHLFVTFTDITPLNYIISLRLNHAIELMNNTNKSIKEIAENVGYSDSLYFGRLFKKKFGITPTEYRKSNTNNKKF